MGVTGQNGTGKSSLFELILGRISSDHGSLTWPQGLEMAHVAQETPGLDTPALDFVLDGDQPLRALERAISRAEADGEGLRLGELHAAYQQIGGYESRSRAQRLLHGLGFQSDAGQKAVKTFSGGWRVRLNLAQALMCRSDLLLLDEPTNHLDLDAVIWLQEWLAAYEGTLLLISHDRDFLDALTTQILHIENGTIQLHSGNYSAFETRRAEVLAQQQAAHSAQQREIARIQSFVSRFRAQATKSRQVQSRLKALDRMTLIAMARSEADFSFDFLPAEKYPSPLLTLEEAQVGYGESSILKGVSFSLAPGQRVGLLGPNGSGKSTLMKLLAGQLMPQRGTRLPAQDLRIGYFAQHHLEQLDGEHSPLWHLQQLDPMAQERALRGFLGQFGFTEDRALSRVAPFSGGEKSRLVLALLVFQRPHLLLLDEPTNHLDLRTRDALNFALQDYPGGVVVVSHDRHLLRSVTETLYIVDSGRLLPFSGELDDYRDWLSNRNSPRHSSGAVPVAKSEDARPQAAEVRKRQRNLNAALEKTEVRLDQLHQQQSTLDQELSDPSLYEADQSDRMAHLLKERARIVSEISVQESEWLRVSDALEALEADRGHA